MDASEIHPATKWTISLPNSRWCRKIVRKRPRIPRTHSSKHFEANRKGFNREKQEMTLKPGETLVRFNATSMYRHHIGPRVQFYVPNTLAWPELLVPIWTCCEKSVLTIVGMWTRIDVFFQILGKGCTKFTLLKENLQRDTSCPGGRLTKIQATARPEKVWPEVWTKIGKKPLRREQSKNGQTSSQSSTMLEGWEAFLSSIRKMVNIKKPQT